MQIQFFYDEVMKYSPLATKQYYTDKIFFMRNILVIN